MARQDSKPKFLEFCRKLQPPRDDDERHDFRPQVKEHSKTRSIWTVKVEKLQLEHLVAYNKQDLLNVHPLRGKSVCGPVVQLIFYICEKLMLSSVIKFHAIDIYDRWLIAIDKELNTFITITNSTLKKDDVVLLEERLRKTTLLRICTCIQLASKFATQRHYVKNSEIKTLLEEMGHRFEIKQLISSEMRIFCALNFELGSATSFEAVELLLKVLYLSHISDFKSLRKISMKILTFVYLFKSKIYSAFYDGSGKKQNQESYLITKEETHRNENDIILRAAASVLCATMMSRTSCFVENTVSQLERCTDLKRETVRGLALCIAVFVLDGK